MVCPACITAALVANAPGVLAGALPLGPSQDDIHVQTTIRALPAPAYHTWSVTLIGMLLQAWLLLRLLPRPPAAGHLCRRLRQRRRAPCATVVCSVWRTFALDRLVAGSRAHKPLCRSCRRQRSSSWRLHALWHRGRHRGCERRCTGCTGAHADLALHKLCPFVHNRSAPLQCTDTSSAARVTYEAHRVFCLLSWSRCNVPKTALSLS